MSKIHICISITQYYKEIDYRDYYNIDSGVFEDLAEAQKFIRQCHEHGVDLYRCSGNHEIKERGQYMWFVEMHDGLGSYATIDFCKVD